MSLKQHPDALLEGFEAPIFPVCLIVLSSIHENFLRILDDKALEVAAKQTVGFLKMEQIRTSDDHVWSQGLFFDFEDVNVCIALSHCSDGVWLDRSIAIYCSSVLDEPMDLIANTIAAQHLIAHLVHQMLKVAFVYCDPYKDNPSPKNSSI